MVKTIYRHRDYKLFLRDWMQGSAKKGRGLQSRIAEHLGMSSVSVSYILSGNRNFSEEQAIELAEFLGLSEGESEYFLLLVQRARAGSKKLEDKLDQRLLRLQKEARDLKARVPEHPELDESAKARFYSNWYFSAIRLLTSIDGLNQIDVLSDRLQMPRALVREVIDFLLRYGLCRDNDGKLEMGPQRTHIPATSPLAAAHHRNWRLKAIEHLDTVGEDELFFSGPMTLSEETFSQIRSDLVETTARITRSVEPSTSELLACVNLDLFKIRK